MNFAFFQDLPQLLSDYYVWVQEQNSLCAFGVGLATWFIIERFFARLSSPITKAITVIGVLFGAAFILACLMLFAGAVEKGSNPFEKQVRDPTLLQMKEVVE